MTHPVAALARHPALISARADLANSDERTLDLQSTLSAIPAPTGRESARATEVASVMRKTGLTDVSTDDVGNVSGWYGDRAAGPPVVVAAHLDTVFGAEEEFVYTSTTSAEGAPQTNGTPVND